MSRGGVDKGKTFYDLMGKEQADEMTIAVLTSKLEQTGSFLRSIVQELNDTLGLNEKANKKMDLVDLSAKISGLTTTLCGLYKTSEGEHKRVMDKLGESLVSHNVRLIGNILKCSDDQKIRICELVRNVYLNGGDEKTLTKDIIKVVSRIEKAHEEELFKIASNIVASRNSFIRSIECRYVVSFNSIIQGE